MTTTAPNRAGVKVGERVGALSHTEGRKLFVFGYRVRGATEVEALPFLNELLGEPASAEAQIDRTTKRQVLATLLRAGRHDLARAVVSDDL